MSLSPMAAALQIRDRNYRESETPCARVFQPWRCPDVASKIHWVAIATPNSHAVRWGTHPILPLQVYQTSRRQLNPLRQSTCQSDCIEGVE